MPKTLSLFSIMMDIVRLIKVIKLDSIWLPIFDMAAFWGCFEKLGSMENVSYP